MPITSDGFERYSEDELYDRLVLAFEQQFDSSVEPGDLVKEQFESLAETLYENQEAALQQVYQSAYLESATGDELEKLVARLGLQRRDASPATGVEEFYRTDPPTSSYTIPRGTVVQTRGSDPIQYETETVASLRKIDDFSDGDIAEYTGDVGDYTVVDHGTVGWALEVPAIADSTIEYTERQFSAGTTFNLDTYFDADSSIGFKFGADDFGSDYYEARINDATSEIGLYVYSGGTVASSQTTAIDVPDSSAIHVEVGYGIAGSHRLTLYQSSNRDTEIASVTIDDSTYLDGGSIGYVSRDSTGAAYVSHASTTHATANIEAVEGGVDTNVSADRIVNSSVSLTGIDGQTNPLPTGDSGYTGVNGNAFVQGTDRETDEELRERAFESTIIGGAATAGSLESAIRDVEHVDSLTLYNNRTDSTVDGLPSHSFEAAVYYSGPDEDIANAIFDTKSIDSNSVGGVNGTEVTYNVQSSVIDGGEEIRWSAIPETQLAIELTLIVDDTYVGNDEIRSRVVNYVGGTDVDGTVINGLSVGEDLYVAVLKDVLVSPDDTGVWEVDSTLIDSNNDGTDDTTTLANGADVYEVASNEVVVANGRDGSITINTVSK